MGSKIQSIIGRQIFSERGHPGIETTVIAEDGVTGVATATAGISVGQHEVQFVYDGGSRWRGRGVQKAASHVNDILAPKLRGMDVTQQHTIDHFMLSLDGTPNKSKLGGNALASVSAAVLKAAAASLEIPLYQHVGGISANTLPAPAVGSLVGSTRFGGDSKRSGGKPSYSFVCYGFPSFSEASYACWNISETFLRLMAERFNLKQHQSRFRFIHVPEGVVTHDQEIWDTMTDAIDEAGYKNQIGIQVDVAAGTYYDIEKQKFLGLFSHEEKSKEDLIELYKEMTANYPFVILEDPLDEVDYEGHAVLTKELSVEVVGDDLFTTNPKRLQQGIDVGACNAILLKVNQIGTISEAFDVVQLAYKHGYGVMPCSSRGEGPAIADYAVGLNTGHIRESGLGPSGNRFLQIELELGARAKFAGKAGLKP
ncbi:MAG: phosphopyruvate hydratase [Candidatus Bathyarchaeota archaeon]|jgi:enolase|nr:phosphopyruvate hydratase [Candidatus Bathyarchaeota archaeon]